MPRARGPLRGVPRAGSATTNHQEARSSAALEVGPGPARGFISALDQPDHPENIESLRIRDISGLVHRDPLATDRLPFVPADRLHEPSSPVPDLPDDQGAVRRAGGLCVLVAARP